MRPSAIDNLRRNLRAVAFAYWHRCKVDRVVVTATAFSLIHGRDPSAAEIDEMIRNELATERKGTP